MPKPHEHLDQYISESPARQHSPCRYCSHQTPQAESSQPHGPSREARLIQSRNSRRLTGNTSRREPEASSHSDTRIRTDCTGVTDVCIGGCGRSVEMADDGIDRETWNISCSTCLDRSAGRRWRRCKSWVRRHRTRRYTAASNEESGGVVHLPFSILVEC